METGVVEQRDPLTAEIVGAAIEVHRASGPGLLESAYEECLAFELAARGVLFQRQVALPVIYKGHRLDCGYRMDLVVAESVVVEVKAIEKLLPVHEAQLLTYMRLAGLQKGLLMNFHTPVIRNGIIRRVL